MTRAVELPARQVTALCRGAAKAGFIPEVKIGNVVVRLVPAIPAVHAQDDGLIDETTDPATFQTFDEWDAWKERKRARAADRRP